MRCKLSISHVWRVPRADGGNPSSVDVTDALAARCYASNTRPSRYFGVPPRPGQPPRGRAALACFVKCFTDRCTPARHGGEPTAPRVGVNLRAIVIADPAETTEIFSGNAMVCSCRAQQRRDGRRTDRSMTQLLLVASIQIKLGMQRYVVRPVDQHRARHLKAARNDRHCN
jgi:hypothetical protein